MEVGITRITTDPVLVKEKPFLAYRFPWVIQKKTKEGIFCKGGNPPRGWAEKYWTNWSKEDLAKVSYEPKEEFFPWTNLASIRLKDNFTNGIPIWGTVVYIEESKPYHPVPYEHPAAQRHSPNNPGLSTRTSSSASKSFLFVGQPATISETPLPPVVRSRVAVVPMPNSQHTPNQTNIPMSSETNTASTPSL